MLLNQGDTLSSQFSIWVHSLSFLNEDRLASRSLEVFGENSSAFGDDGSGFVVLKNPGFEFFRFLGSLSIEVKHISSEAF